MGLTQSKGTALNQFDYVARLLACLAASACCAWSMAADMDGDGIDDAADNCSVLHNPDQRDSNADGFGNACDMDLNNDHIVNAVDLGLLRLAFFSDDVDADSNGDGVVNVVDLGVLRSQFFMPPGPGAQEPLYTQRVVRIEADNLMAGLDDSVSEYTYWPDGSVRQVVSTRVAADPDDPPPNYLGQTDFVYTPDGQVKRQTTSLESSSTSFVSDTQLTYIDGRLIQSDGTFERNGITTYRRGFWNYGNGALRTIDRFTGPSIEQLQPDRESQRFYDDQGRPSLQLEVPVDPDDEFGRTQYVWNADGSLELSEERDTEAGVVTRLRTTFFVHEENRLVQTSRFEFSEPEPRIVENWFYDEDGRLSSVDFDFNADGIIDSRSTYIWEDGPCRRQVSRSVDPVGRRDGRLDSGLSVWALCHP